jgi:hypothetical protein
MLRETLSGIPRLSHSAHCQARDLSSEMQDVHFSLKRLEMWQDVKQLNDIVGVKKAPKAFN